MSLLLFIMWTKEMNLYSEFICNYLITFHQRSIPCPVTVDSVYVSESKGWGTLIIEHLSWTFMTVLTDSSYIRNTILSCWAERADFILPLLSVHLSPLPPHIQMTRLNTVCGKKKIQCEVFILLILWAIVSGAPLRLKWSVLYSAGSFPLFCVLKCFPFYKGSLY